MIIVIALQPLTIITKHSILDVAAALDPPLTIITLGSLNSLGNTLRENCPNTGLFLVRIFLHSVRIQENAGQK